MDLSSLNCLLSKTFLIFSVIDTKPKSTQQRLEDNFFHNQPDHLKQIVDNITERISNNFVRTLKEKLIPDESKLVKNVVTTNLSVYEGMTTVNDDLIPIKEELLNQLSLMAEQAHVKIQKRFYEKMEEELDKKANPALDCLLPDDTKTCIIEFGSQIIRKRVKKNAKQYIKSNFSRGK